MLNSHWYGFYCFFFVCSLCRCSNCGRDSEASSKTENFYELQMNVKGLKSLDESLDQYLSVEQLHGENQYNCELCKSRVDATHRIRLRTLPDVLNFQLKRYEFLPKVLCDIFSRALFFVVLPLWNLITISAFISIPICEFRLLYTLIFTLVVSWLGSSLFLNDALQLTNENFCSVLIVKIITCMWWDLHVMRFEVALLKYHAWVSWWKKVNAWLAVNSEKNYYWWILWQWCEVGVWS
jgi:hypothetical protein